MDFIDKANKYKGEESHFLLHCFNLSNMTLDEYVKIISSLKNVPICIKLDTLYNQSKGSVSVDWEYETEKRDKEIKELKNSSFKPKQTKGEYKGIGKKKKN